MAHADNPFCLFLNENSRFEFLIVNEQQNPTPVTTKECVIKVEEQSPSKNVSLDTFIDRRIKQECIPDHLLDKCHWNGLEHVTDNSPVLDDTITIGDENTEAIERTTDKSNTQKTETIQKRKPSKKLRAERKQSKFARKQTSARKSTGGHYLKNNASSNKIDEEDENSSCQSSTSSSTSSSATNSSDEEDEIKLENNGKKNFPTNIEGSSTIHNGVSRDDANDSEYWSTPFSEQQHYLNPTVLFTKVGYNTNRCPYCMEFFGSLSDVDQHCRINHSDCSYDKFQCAFCKNPCTHLNNLIRHVRVHTKETPFMCRFCRRKFTNASACTHHSKNCLKANYREIAERPEFKPIIELCPVDPHKISDIDSQEEDEVITILDEYERFVIGNVLKEICREVINNCNEKNNVKEKIQPVAKSRSRKYPYQCSRCGKQFSTNLFLTKHLRLHTAMNRKFVCGVCDYRFMNRSHLADHMKVHQKSENTNFNNSRKKCLNNEESMTSYVGQSKDSNIEQPVELRSVQSISSKNEHLKGKKSSKDGRHICRHCGKLFRSTKVLYKHLSVHSMKRKKVCTICGYRFIKTGNLNQHIARVHCKTSKVVNASDKIWTKSETDVLRSNQDFSSVNKKSTILICKYCESTFTTKSGLRKHMKVVCKSLHYINVRFDCEICNRVFGNLHLRKRHEIKCKRLSIKSSKTSTSPQKAVNDTKADNSAEIVSAATCNSITLHPVKSNRCEHCGKLLPSQCGLTRHLKLHYKVLHNGNENLHCENCNRDFSTVYFRKLHETKCKRLVKPCRNKKVVSKSSNVIANSSLSSTKRNSSEAGLTNENLTDSVNKETASLNHADPISVPSFTCEHCGKIVQTSNGLKVHQQVFCKGLYPNQENFHCGFCYQYFASSSALKMHKEKCKRLLNSLSHRRVTPGSTIINDSTKTTPSHALPTECKKMKPKCGHCGSLFTSVTGVRRHLVLACKVVHKKEFLNCSICNYSFANNQLLKCHEMKCRKMTLATNSTGNLNDNKMSWSVSQSTPNPRISTEKNKAILIELTQSFTKEKAINDEKTEVSTVMTSNNYAAIRPSTIDSVSTSTLTSSSRPLRNYLKSPCKEIGKQPGIFICEVCYKIFRSEYLQSLHVRRCRKSLTTDSSATICTTSKMTPSSNTNIDCIQSPTSCEFKTVLGEIKDSSTPTYETNACSPLSTKENVKEVATTRTPRNIREKPASCLYCGVKLYQFINMKKHLNSCKEIKTLKFKTSTACKFCGNNLSSSQSLKKHLRRSCNVINHGERSFQCRVCKRTLTNIHLRKVHEKKCKRLSKDSRNSLKTCMYCKCVLKSEESLEKHMKQNCRILNYNKERFKCKICSHTFDRIFMRERHEKNCLKKSENSLRCEICSRTFLHSYTLKRHKLICKSRSKNTSTPKNNSTTLKPSNELEITPSNQSNPSVSSSSLCIVANSSISDPGLNVEIITNNQTALTTSRINESLIQPCMSLPRNTGNSNFDNNTNKQEKCESQKNVVPSSVHLSPEIKRLSTIPTTSAGGFPDKSKADETPKKIYKDFSVDFLLSPGIEKVNSMINNDLQIPIKSQSTEQSQTAQSYSVDEGLQILTEPQSTETSRTALPCHIDSTAMNLITSSVPGNDSHTTSSNVDLVDIGSLKEKTSAIQRDINIATNEAQPDVQTTINKKQIDMPLQVVTNHASQFKFNRVKSPDKFSIKLKSPPARKYTKCPDCNVKVMSSFYMKHVIMHIRSDGVEKELPVELCGQVSNVDLQSSNVEGQDL